MKKISEIDSNFTEKNINGCNLAFRDPKEPPFRIAGLAWFDAEKKFCRLPVDCLPQMSKGIQELSWHTAGVMVRFCTDSTTLAIDACLRSHDDMSHMPRTGSSGFDLYIGEGIEQRYVGTVKTDRGKDTIQALIATELSREMKTCTVTFPLYNGVNQLQVGLDSNARIDTAPHYAYERPLAFYGSSITQGGCASRSANSYPHFIGRWLDAQVLNFGFSGNAKGELEMAKLIASLELSAFIYDYDHNAPDVEHLEATHELFFKLIRNAHPSLPIVIVSSPNFRRNVSRFSPRREVIQKTYHNAKSANDGHVFFVDGETLYGQEDDDACTVDGCHPNDLGFYRMAKGIYPAIREALGLPVV